MKAGWLICRGDMSLMAAITEGNHMPMTPTARGTPRCLPAVPRIFSARRALVRLSSVAAARSVQQTYLGHLVSLAVGICINHGYIILLQGQLSARK